MTDFATELLWEEEKQPSLLVPSQEPGRLRDRHKEQVRPRSPVEGPNERLQRVAGNAALARDAESALAAARQPSAADPRSVAPAAPAVARASPEQPSAPATAVREPAEPSATERLAPEKSSVSVCEPSLEQQRAAAARGLVLGQVLAAFERDAAAAKLLQLALLVEAAPVSVGEAIALALARAVMRADPAQRAAIAARIKTQLGDRRELRLTQLLAARLAAFLATQAVRPTPPAPPPAPTD